MDRPGELMKKKALELAEKLESRFPMQLPFVRPAITTMSSDRLLKDYCATVHALYADKIRSRDETFFMSTSDFDDPMGVVGLLRGLWTNMSEDDKKAIWQYMDVFEKIARRASPDN